MKRFIAKFVVVGAVFGLLVVMSARAETITFDSVPSVGNPILTTLTTAGYTFTSGHFHTMDNPSTASFGGAVDNGTIYISEEAGALGLPITMAPTGGGTFSLVGFDGAEQFIDSLAAAVGGYPNADLIDVTGYLSGGGTVFASFALDGIKDGLGGAPDFQTFLLPATFAGLDSVVFSGSLYGPSILAGGPGGISLDNIVVKAAVPDAGSTWLLLGVAILGLGGLKRRAGRSSAF